MMLSLPPLHRRGPVWRFAAEVLNEAAADRASVPDAEAKFTRALQVEGLIRACRHPDESQRAMVAARLANAPR